MKRRTFLGTLGALFLPITVVAKTIGDDKITPPTQGEDFYQFFLNFNGFQINDAQRNMFWCYRNKITYQKYSRRHGVSTFMLTLAAWEAFNGKNVVHFSSSEMLTDLIRKQYDKKIYERFDGKSPNIDFVNIKRKKYPSKGLRYDIALYDQSDPYFHEEWSYIIPMVEKHLLLKTYDI